MSRTDTAALFSSGDCIAGALTSRAAFPLASSRSSQSPTAEASRSVALLLCIERNSAVPRLAPSLCRVADKHFAFVALVVEATNLKGRP